MTRSQHFSSYKFLLTEGKALTTKLALLVPKQACLLKWRQAFVCIPTLFTTKPYASQKWYINQAYQQVPLIASCS